MEERNPLTDFWPAIAIAAVVTVSILVTVLWMQREEMKLTKQELMATKVELLDSLSKKVESRAVTTTEKTPVEPANAVSSTPSKSEYNAWSDDWIVRNLQYQIDRPNYQLECVGERDFSFMVTKTRLINIGKDGLKNVIVEDIKKAGMDVTCGDVFLILEPKGSSKVYFVVSQPPSVGPVFAFDPTTMKFTQAKTHYFEGRRLDYVVSPDQRYIANIGKAENKLEVNTIAVYDVVKDEVKEIGKLKAGESYTKSLFLFNSMASGEPVASLIWAPAAKLSANIYSSKVPLKEDEMCGIDYPDCFERKPIRTVELMP